MSDLHLGVGYHYLQNQTFNAQKYGIILWKMLTFFVYRWKEESDKERKIMREIKRKILK